MKTKTKNAKIEVRIPSALKDAAKKRAKAQGCALSDAMTAFIENYALPGQRSPRSIAQYDLILAAETLLRENMEKSGKLNLVDQPAALEFTQEMKRLIEMLAPIKRTLRAKAAVPKCTS